MNKITVVLLVAAAFFSCENPIRLETKVHEDGSLDKTIILEKTDSTRATANMFGINAETGWDVASEKNPKEDSDKKFKIAFKKSFPSVEAVNKELDTSVDSLFHIHSEFEKRFRWFYTYIRYSETFRPIDRFKLINRDDYFNREDSLFIDRLPGEGAIISKADSVFLKQLNDKISETYLQDALFAEYFDILKTVVQKNTTDKKWLDTLLGSKEMIYNEMDEWDGDQNFAWKLSEKLGIPLAKEGSVKDFTELSKNINSRVSFMSFAQDGKYTNIIDMPWTVVNSNADSVAGNKLYWRPLPTKFAIQEYTMFAESRRLNLWAVGVSILVLGFTVLLLFQTNTRG